MKTSMENRKQLGTEKMVLLRVAKPVATRVRAPLDHQTTVEAVLRAEHRKAAAITLLRSHPQIY